MQKSSKEQTLFIVGGIVLVAVVAFIGIILLGQGGLNPASSVNREAPAMLNQDGSYILGDENAPITIVVFSDYFCGHCQTYKSTVDRIITDYVNTGKARLEHRLLGNLGADSIRYAQLTECATAQGDASSAWEAMDLLFNYAMTRRLNASDAGRELATALQLNYSRLLECTSTADQYQIDKQIANGAQVSGTPAIRVRFAGDELSALQLISPQYTGGGVDYNVLARIIEDANN